MTKVSKILILNGPPNAGLQELAGQLQQQFNAITVSTLAAVMIKPSRAIIPDLGLRAELSLLIETFGASNIQIVHVVRDGYTFDRDPREYVDDANVDAITVFYNEETNGLTLGLIAYIFFEVAPNQR